MSKNWDEQAGKMDNMCTSSSTKPCKSVSYSDTKTHLIS